MAQLGPGFGGPGTGEVNWNLSAVQFDDGGTASGWFMYDYAARDCSVDLTTTGGLAFAGAHYTSCLQAIWGVGTSAITFSTVPDSNSAVGTPFLDLWSLSFLPDTNSGGTLSLTTGSAEYVCDSVYGSTCTGYSRLRTITGGEATTTPEPTTLGFALLGVGPVFAYWVLSRKGDRAAD